MARKRKKTDLFEGLTWNDLTSWAGSKIVSRGKSYQRSGYVKELACAPDGSLIAWVDGTERYATQVFFEDDELESDCTCPYWDTCKHAVAVVVEYLENLIAEVTPKAYEKAAVYLRKVCRVLGKKKKDTEWQSYLSEIRRKHARKIKLLEILDGLNDKRIVDTL